MENWKEIISHTTFRYVNHTTKNTFNNEPYTALTSFAIDDVLTLSVSDALSPPVMRLWVHPKTIVLGIPDARLPYIDEGVKLLAEQGYHVIVRNSGGLAVALDDGVLNISLILPDIKRISIHDSYEAMFSFIKHMLRHITNDIEAYEIVGSFCPGDYDLSINGIKFAGISQRRIKNGAAIQIYIDIEGNSQKRATLIKDFYEHSLRDEKTKFTYPVIDPHVMGSLTQLLNRKITVQEIKTYAHSALEEISDHIITKPFSPAEMTIFSKRFEQMNKRNMKIAELQSFH